MKNLGVEHFNEARWTARGKEFVLEQIIWTLCDAEVALARGKTVPNVVRKLGVTEQPEPPEKKLIHLPAPE
jgi:hypothetical protein